MIRYVSALLSVSLLLSGCNSASDVGKQESLAPQAVATVVGQSFDAMPNGDAVVTVRSGAQVVLSGKDSVDADSAIIGYRWEPVSTDPSVSLIVRNRSTVSFTAPLLAVGATAQLKLRLTVTASDQTTATAMATVNVISANDTNRFLSMFTSVTEPKFQIVAAADRDVALDSDVKFRITVQRRVKYKGRADPPLLAPNSSDCSAPGERCTTSPLMDLTTIDETWRSAAGIAGPAMSGGATDWLVAGQSFKNPRLTLPIPRLDRDRINQPVQDELDALPVGTADTQRNQVIAKFLDPGSVDSAATELLITLQVTAGVLDPAAKLALVLLSGAGDEVLATGTGDSQSASVTVTTEALRAQSNVVVESAATARDYYAAIDPMNRKTDMNAWLRDNCFDPTRADLGADRHTVYVNDFDLGFGRDMYFKTNCTPAQAAATGATIKTDQGERASIVINYPTLEGAVRKVGVVLAVAMEYRRPEDPNSTTTAPFTSFYSFAPDPKTGAFPRVLSVDFDARGERYQPGVCVACHGGQVRQRFVGNPDIGAQFLPWDLNSFLFADTDPLLATASDFATINTQFSRSAQEGEFRRLNEAVLSTWVDEPGTTPEAQARNAKRQAFREVVHGWYGDGVDRARAGNDCQPLRPDDWQPTTMNDLPDVAFDGSYVPLAWRGCSGPAGASSSDQVYLSVVAQNCRACHLTQVTSPVTPQYATHTEFLNSAIRQRTYTEGLMPFARLTSDRFWLPQPGASAPAAILLGRHLGLTDDELSIGRPRVGGEMGPAVSKPQGDGRGLPVIVDAEESVYVGQYDWQLTYTPAATLPHLPAAPPVIGAKTSRAAFVPSHPGTYAVRVMTTNAQGDTATFPDPSQPEQVVATIPDNVPQTCASLPGSPVCPLAITVEAATVKTVSELIAKLTTQLQMEPALVGDGPSTVTVPLQPGIDGSGTAIFFAASTPLMYTLTDQDGQSVTGQFTVNATNAPTVQAVTVNVTRASRIGSGDCQAVDVSTIDLSAGASVTNGGALQVRVFPLTTTTSQGGTVSAATANAVMYCPPSGFVSQKTRSAAQDVPDTFAFKAELLDANGVAVVTSANTGTARVTVTAQSRFESSVVTNVLKSGECNSCHGSALTDASWNAGMPTDLLWATFLNQPTATQPCPLNETPATSDVCVNVARPQDNYLTRKAVGELNHNGTGLQIYSGCTLSDPTRGYTCTDPNDATQLNAIYRWILEGANNN